MIAMNTGEVAVVVIQGVILVLMAIALFNGALAWPTDRHLAMFGSAYEVPITPTNRRPLAMYIWWSRAWRIGGAVVAFVVAQVIEAFTDTTDLAGVLVLGVGYVRPWVLVGMAMSTVALILTLLRYVQLDALHADRVDPPWVELDRTAAIVLTTVLVLGAGVTVVLGQFLARRPQRIESGEIAAVEHAIRSSAIVSLSGCGLMLTGAGTMFLAMRVSWLASGTDVAFRSLHGWVHVVGFITTFTGLMLSWRAIPRFAPFWRRLPAVPPETA